MDKEKQIVRNRYIIKGLLVFLYVSIIQLLTALIYAIVKYMNYGGDNIMNYIMKDMKKDNVLLSCICNLICIALAFYIYNYADFKLEKPDYKKSFNAGNVLAIIFSGMGTMVFVNTVLSIFCAAFPALFENYNKLIDSIVDKYSLVSIVSVMIIGPVTEEMIFRGAILKRFNFVLPFFAANIFQAVLFGLFHGNVIQAIYAFAFGLLQGLIYKCVGSIWATIIVHMLANGISFLMSYVQEEGNNWPGNLGQTTFLFIIVLGIIMFFASFIYWIKMYPNVKDE